MDTYSEFIRLRTYSRWLPDKGRRETWDETTDRFCDFIFNKTYNCQNIPEKTKKKIIYYKKNKEVMGSMRLVWSAGENCIRDNISAYNCSGVVVNSLVCFGEAMYILLAGAGVGYSVEKKWISQLPDVVKQRNLPILRFVVDDTRLGWKEAVDFGVTEWFNGRDVVFDLSRIRPAGTPLVTSGGYACLTGDTVVLKGRHKKSVEENNVTIAHLYKLQETSKAKFDKVMIRSLNLESGAFFRDKPIKIIHNGVAPVFEVITKNGYKIRATANHRFLDRSYEWKKLEHFVVGDGIAVNGEKKSRHCVGFDTIDSVTPCGSEEVFDICMESEHHNFVANGFVSHNSGPEPLSRCLEFLRDIVIGAQGRKLNSIEVFDMMCEIGASVVSGGVRRTAMACLTDVDDILMQNAKQGTFHPRRFMANISAVYTKKPDVLDFTQEFVDMARSGSGERGIFNLVAAKKRSPRRRDKTQIVVSNPCFETLLRDMGLCNLSEVVIRATDDFDSIVDKIKTATWLGCIQSTLTNFPHMRQEWAKNAEEERLIGVSITGLCDNIGLITPETLRHWRNTAVKTAKLASTTLGINMPAAICVQKPSGTVSQFVDCSAGLHSRWSPYYIRRVRISTHDALYKTMVDQGVPYEMDRGNHDTAVFSFPIKAPDGAKTRDQDTALGQLEWYRAIVENWCEMNSSCTVFVKDNEWLDVIAYVYKYFDTVNGVSFFPYDNKKYEQAPYEEISEIEYHRMVKDMPTVDFSRLSEYETSDNTEGAQTYACVGNSCDIA